MRCIDCGVEKDPDERGWVTVLSPSGSARIHYCPACIANLVQHAFAVEDADPADRAG